MKDVWKMLYKQAGFMEAPLRNLQDLKYLLLTSWYKIPQDTFRDQVEAMSQWFRAVLIAKGGPTQHGS